MNGCGVAEEEEEEKKKKKKKKKKKTSLHVHMVGVSRLTHSVSSSRLTWLSTFLQ